MRKVLGVISACFIMSLLIACSYLGINNTPRNLTSADESHYNTIGVEFRQYFEADEALAEDVELIYDEALDSWLANGSDWEVYDVVVGMEEDGPYVVYVESNEDLTEADVEARMVNVLAWELNLETRLGLPVENNEETE